MTPAVSGSEPARAARSPVESRHGPRYTAASYIGPSSSVAFFPAHHHFAIPRHDHDFYELGIVESGAGLHVAAGIAQPIGRGTVVFVPPGVGHEYRECVEMRVLNCFFKAELDEVELSWAFRDAGLRRLFNPTGIAAARELRPVVVRQLDEPALRRMFDALDGIRTVPSERRTRALELGHLIVALDVLASGDEIGTVLPADRVPIPAIAAQACELLEQDLAYPWTLAELSARLYVGPFHLARQFGRSVGVPPMHYVARRRAETAARLLVASDASIAAVGIAVGWPDPSQFSRRFRAAFGVSPSSYRRTHRERAVGPTSGPVVRAS